MLTFRSQPDQVSCRMTITKMMITKTPMIVPMIPRFTVHLRVRSGDSGTSSTESPTGSL